MKHTKPRIALFGGAFNPFHNGHLAIINNLLNTSHVNEVWLIPSGLPSHKYIATSVYHRIEMLNSWLVSYSSSNVKISRYEADILYRTYTVTTVSYFQSQFPDYDFFWVIGMDAFFNIHCWYRWEYLISKIPFLVFNRGEYNEKDIQKYAFQFLNLLDLSSFYFMDNEVIDISSTFIRDLMTNHKSILEYIPLSVLKYIDDNGLYI